MWLKLMYFLRIFENTGYLVRMIIVVIVDMKSFLIVLMIGLVAFGDSFATIASGNEDIGAYVFTSGLFDSILYVYLIILGGFDIADYDGAINYVLAMTLFLLCTIFNMIVMLNLLIAIISESFAKVNSNAKNATYQEKASLIAENNYLIPDERKASYAPKYRHLMVITDLEAVESEFSDPVLQAMCESKVEVMEEITGLKEEFDNAKDAQQKLTREILEEAQLLKSQFQTIYNHVEKKIKPKKVGEESGIE
mmetsp:Transcript_19002/g.13799  ORF Transcript_19002/g.13799 Transcript_19002/m.13799 type:complete len:251 (+) Transcript_19002:4679-5431(+)